MRLVIWAFLSGVPALLPAVEIPFLASGAPADWKTSGLPQGLRLDAFRQREPRDGQPASQSTIGWLARDRDALYLVVQCAADPDSVRANVGVRDQIGDDDSIGLYLDTFHDRRRAYVFFVNPAGIQMDGVTTEGQEDDYSFDALWESGGRRTSGGFTVWMRIPFRSLHHAAGEQAEWGIALTRYIPSRGEIDTWPYLARSVQGFVPYFHPVASPSERAASGLRLIPYASFRHDQRAEYLAGLDAQWQWAGRLAVDVTLRPDFSQVESDEPQVSRNRRFENFFPEKRPFFLEHADYFETPEQVFFSRRIVAPDSGVRATGELGGWKFGVLAARDQDEDGHPATASVARVRRDFGSHASLGGIATHLDSAGRQESVMGADGWWRFHPRTSLTAQWLTSREDEPGFHRRGQARLADLRYSGRNLHSSLTYRYRSADFHAGLGFMPRVDLEQWSQATGYRFRPSRGALLFWGPSLKLELMRDAAGRLTDWSASVPWTFQWQGPRELTLLRQESLEVFRGLAFRKHRSQVYYSDDRWRRFGWSASWSFGDELNYYPAAGRPVTAHPATEYVLRLTARPHARTRAETLYLRHETRNLYEERLWRAKLSHQISPRLSLRAILDFDHSRPRPDRVNWTGGRQVVGDFLLRYQVNAWTAFYAGCTQRSGPVRDRIFSMKFSYMFQP